jgi:hypothetical protein
VGAQALDALPGSDLGFDLVACLLGAFLGVLGAIPDLRPDIVQRLAGAADRGVDLGPKVLLRLLTGLLELVERGLEVLGCRLLDLLDLVVLLAS